MPDSDSTHPPPTSVRKLALGQLPAEEAVSLEEHLRQCESCRTIFDQVDTGEDPYVTRPDAFWERREMADSVNPTGEPRAWKGDSAPQQPGSDRTERIGDYEILRRLGAGGMGVVYEAWDIRLGRVVAVKVISEAQESPEFEARFRSEAKAVAQLAHPNIVQIFKFGEHDGRLFCAFECVHGGRLDERTRGKSMPLKYVATTIETLARAVQHAHEKGIIHRDLKPANILIAEDGTPKIADFGLAKHLRSSLNHTATGAVMGTAAYMAPEQAACDAITPLVDVYSLGAVLYELLTGAPPFQGQTAYETLNLVRNEKPVPPSRKRPDIDRDLEVICLRCLSKSPSQRYASAAALADDLRRYLDGMPIVARPVGRRERVWMWCKRYPARTCLITITLLLLVGAPPLIVDALFTKRSNMTLREGIKKKDGILAIKDDKVRRSTYALQLRDVSSKSETDPIAGLKMLDDPSKCPSGLQDFAWRYLRHQCRRQLLAVSHRSDLTCIAISNDQRYAVAGSTDGNAYLWKLDAPSDPTIFAGHTDRITRIAFAPRQNRFATASRDHTIRLWDMSRKQPVHVLSGHTDDVNAVVFLSDGMRLASAGRDRLVKLWDLQTGQQELLSHIGGHTDSIFCLAASPNGRWLLSGGKDRSIRVWDLENQALASTEEEAHGGFVTGISFFPNIATNGTTVERLASSAGATGRIRIWSLSDSGILQPERELPEQQAGITSIATLDRDSLSTLDADSTAVTWDLRSDPASAITTIRLPSPTYEIQALPAPTRLVSVGKSGWQMWNASSRKARALGGHDRSVCGVAFSLAAESRLVSASEDGTVRVWEIEQAPEPRESIAIDDRVRSVAVSGSGSVAWSSDGSLHFCEFSALELQRRRSVVTDSLWYHALALSPANDELAAVGTNASATSAVLRLIDLDTANERFACESGASEAMAVAYHPLSERVAVGDSDGNVLIYDSSNGELHGRWGAHSLEIYCLQFAPDGQTLATGSGDQTITIWDWESGTSRAVLRGHAGAVFAVAYSHDGQTLASGSDDGQLRLWDPTIGHERAALSGHDSPIRQLSFSADDQILASGDDAGRILIWEGPTSNEATSPQRAE